MRRAEPPRCLHKDIQIRAFYS
ncbi:UNVERIFIED_CONTAM: hypothetical protein GTU68_010800 [Idotea baltica]|nr:hypothetical protein [Idotea baltica]